MKRKTITMIVTITCPSWLTPAQARREVRTLINDQCFYGHERELTEIGQHNFRAKAVS